MPMFELKNIITLVWVILEVKTRRLGGGHHIPFIMKPQDKS